MSKKKPKKTWGWAPKKTASPQVPDTLRVELTTKANELVESFVKPTFITPPPEDTRWNYLTDILKANKGDVLNCCGKMPSLRKARLPASCNLPEQFGMSPSRRPERTMLLIELAPDDVRMRRAPDGRRESEAK